MAGWLQRPPAALLAGCIASLWTSERAAGLAHGREWNLPTGHADLVLTMTPAHAAEVISRYPHARIRTFTLSAYATGADVAIPDAWGKPMADYRAVLAQLDRYLPAALDRAIAERPAKQ